MAVIEHTVRVFVMAKNTKHNNIFLQILWLLGSLLPPKNLKPPVLPFSFSLSNALAIDGVEVGEAPDVRETD